MGTQTKTVGNSQAQGFGSQFMNFLQGGLSGQGFGTGNGMAPGNATQGIAGVLNGLLSPGAGSVGGSLGTLIQQSQTRGLNSLKGQFGGAGGAGLGTPGAVAQSLYQAQAAPQIATAVSGLQMNALNSIMPYMSGIANKGIQQSQTLVQPSPLAQGISAAAPIVGAIGNILAPGVGSVAGAGLGALGGMGMPASGLPSGGLNFGNLGSQYAAMQPGYASGGGLNFGSGLGYNPSMSIYQ